MRCFNFTSKIRFRNALEPLFSVYLRPVSYCAHILDIGLSKESSTFPVTSGPINFVAWSTERPSTTATVTTTRIMVTTEEWSETKRPHQETITTALLFGRQVSLLLHQKTREIVTVPFSQVLPPIVSWTAAGATLHFWEVVPTTVPAPPRSAAPISTRQWSLSTEHRLEVDSRDSCQDPALNGWTPSFVAWSRLKIKL